MNLVQKVMFFGLGGGVLLLALLKVIATGKLFDDPFSPVLFMIGLGAIVMVTFLLGDSKEKRNPRKQEIAR
jgi:hypothetical protein